MLERSGVPLRKSDRLADESVPLIILGGSNSPHSSLFFVPDPPLDGIFFGESVDAIARLFSLCAEAKGKQLTKPETLALLESVPGSSSPTGHTGRRGCRMRS